MIEGMWKCMRLGAYCCRRLSRYLTTPVFRWLLVGPSAILTIAQVMCRYGWAGSEETEGVKEKADRTMLGDEIQGQAVALS